MATPDSLAKTAREKLAQALNALQTSSDAPVFLLELAEPIAQSMAILHKIERSNGADLTGKDQVSTNVRTVLDKLQTATENHPAVDQVMEFIAGSLSSVHQLARMAAPAPARAPAPAPAAAPAPAPAAAPAPAPAPAAPSGPPPGFAQPPAFAAAPSGASANHGAFATQPIPPTSAGNAFGSSASSPNQTVRMQSPATAATVPQAQPAPAQQFQPAPQAQPAQQFQPAPAVPAAQAFQPAPAATQPLRPQPAAAAPRASAPSQPGGNVLVELGAHSASNFYKGLGGNDVIEHGGIFVATYKIPKLGTQVTLRVLLPGDYEFQATGTVQWIREAGGGDAEPGFGARLTQITPEGRQLVYRYTRNREPMFYDDL